LAAVAAVAAVALLEIGGGSNLGLLMVGFPVATNANAPTTPYTHTTLDATLFTYAQIVLLLLLS
jgi:hypothetical protein